MTISPLSIATDGYLRAGTGRTIAIASSGYIDIFDGVVVPRPPGGGSGFSAYTRQKKAIRIPRVSDEDIESEDIEIISLITAFLNITTAGRKLPWDL
jgi:hypothetical protein